MCTGLKRLNQSSAVLTEGKFSLAANGQPGGWRRWQEGEMGVFCAGGELPGKWIRCGKGCGLPKQFRPHPNTGQPGLTLNALDLHFCWRRSSSSIRTAGT